MSKRVYVAGITSSATEEQLLKLFDRSGRIWKGVFKRGYAFLDFDTHDGARNAIERFNEEYFMGRRLVVEWANRQEPHDRETLQHSTSSTTTIIADELQTSNSDVDYGIVLSGLPSSAGYQEIRCLAVRYCTDVKRIVRGRDVGGGSTTAYITFSSFDAARLAARRLNNNNLRGFRIQARELTSGETESLARSSTAKEASSSVSRTASSRSNVPSPCRPMRGPDTDYQGGNDASRHRRRSRSPMARHRNSPERRRYSDCSNDIVRRSGSSRTDMLEYDRPRRSEGLSGRSRRKNSPSRRGRSDHRSRSRGRRTSSRYTSDSSDYYDRRRRERTRSRSPIRRRLFNVNGPPRSGRPRSRSYSPQRRDKHHTHSAHRSSQESVGNPRDGKENEYPRRSSKESY